MDHRDPDRHARRVRTTGIATTVFNQGWGFLWNTTTVPNGVYRLDAVVFDAGGHHSTSKVVTITVAN